MTFSRSMYYRLVLWALCLLCWSNTSLFAERDPYHITVYNDQIRPDLAVPQQKFRQQASWRNFIQRNGAWHVAFDGYTALPMQAAGTPIATLGDTDEARVRHFLQTEWQGYPFPLAEMQYSRTNISRKYHIVVLEQFYKGLPVLNATMRVRLNEQSDIVSVAANIHPRIDIATTATLAAQEVGTYAMQGMVGTLQAETPHLAVMPLLTEAGYAYKLVYTMQVRGQLSNGKKADYFTCVDAHNGAVYYRQNRVVYCNFEQHSHQSDAAINVETEISENPETPLTMHFMPDMRIRIGTTDYFTDENGVLDYPGTEIVSGTAYFEGPHSQIRINTGNTTPSYPVTIDPAAATMTIDIPAAQLSVPSGFLHVNRQYRHLKQWLPEDIGMEDPMRTFVDITDGSCNAYYDGDVNFYAEADGCAATAQVSDVVYHEYGHGINYYFYEANGSTFDNGSLGEGYADVWGLKLTNNPILGPGFSGTGTWVRRYDTNIKVYPQDLTGEVHDNGEIIAGAWWDLGQEIGMDEMFALFIESQYAVAMRPDGQEGLLYSDILFDALLADDDNDNIFDGTPHGVAIIEAFSLHGITLLVGADIAHSELPTYAADIPIPINTSVSIDFDFTPFLAGLEVGYRTSDTEPYQTVTATDLGDGEYTANIPAQPKGTIIDYYIALVDNVGGRVYAPFGIKDPTPNIPYQLLIGYQTIETQAFSTTAGSADWQYADVDDDATSGMWDIGIPQGSYVGGAAMVQTNTDNTPTSDNRCAFTGNSSLSDSPGDNDVDAGKNTLISENYNLIQLNEPAFSFYRWYSNDQGANPGNDNWRVDISNDGGNTWVPIEDINFADHSWRMVAFKVSDYVTPSSETLLRFIASDILIPGTEFDGGSLVEAAVDDVVLYQVDNSVGINTPQSNANLLRSYPNPAQEQLHIAPLKDARHAALALYDISGKTVWAQSGIDLSQVRYTLPVGSLPKGSYLLELNSEIGTFRQMVVVQ